MLRQQVIIMVLTILRISFSLPRKEYVALRETDCLSTAAEFVQNTCDICCCIVCIQCGIYT